MLLGDDPEARALLDSLGLAWHPGETAALGAADLAVVPASAAPNCGPALRGFVARGGTVLLLPQTRESLAAAGLPWALPLHEVRAARAEIQGDAKDPLVRGLGPQLTHWRTFLEGSVFAREGLPPGARRLRGGWLLRVPEGAGQWVCCQVDWLRLPAGDNTLRARWNTQKLYRQLLTNLGAVNDAALTTQFLNPRHFAPMRDVNVWQVLQQAVPIPAETGPNSTFPGLAEPPAAERWVQDPSPDQRQDFTWRLRAMDANGYLNLTHVAAPRLGQAGYAVTHLYSSVARSATVAVSADYWLVLRVNGTVVVDQSREPRPAAAPKPGEIRLRVPLRAGWNRLEVRVASGTGGFGFWCQVSDPGDLRLSPTVTVPENTPAAWPAVADLRAEPVTSGAQLLYAEALQKEDDPYGFTPW